MSHPLVGWRTSDQDGWGLRSNIIGRGIFEDFHAGSKGNLYSKIATPRKGLGVSDFIRFMQQFNKGSGNYVEDRQEWQKQYSVKQLIEEIQVGSDKQ